MTTENTTPADEGAEVEAAAMAAFEGWREHLRAVGDPHFADKQTWDALAEFQRDMFRSIARAVLAHKDAPRPVLVAEGGPVTLSPYEPTTVTLHAPGGPSDQEVTL